MQLTIEVLPAPFGPMMEYSSPSLTPKETSVSARTPPKRSDTPRTSKACSTHPLRWRYFRAIYPGRVAYPIRLTAGGPVARGEAPRTSPRPACGERACTRLDRGSDCIERCNPGEGDYPRVRVRGESPSPQPSPCKRGEGAHRLRGETVATPSHTSSHSLRTAALALRSEGVPSNTMRPWPIT